MRADPGHWRCFGRAKLTMPRHRITNAGLEAINTKVQEVKRRSGGFRSRERFKIAIYFHCGGLDFHPTGAAIRP